MNVKEQHTDIQGDAKQELHDTVQNITTSFHKVQAVLMDLKTVKLFVLLVIEKPDLTEVINRKISNYD